MSIFHDQLQYIFDKPFNDAPVREAPIKKEIVELEVGSWVWAFYNMSEVNNVTCDKLEDKYLYMDNGQILVGNDEQGFLACLDNEWMKHNDFVPTQQIWRTVEGKQSRKAKLRNRLIELQDECSKIVKRIDEINREKP